jgi:hypothetical protein
LGILAAAGALGTRRPLLLTRTAFCLDGRASGAMLIQVVAIAELLPATITFQLVLVLHVKSPLIQAVEGRLFTRIT